MKDSYSQKRDLNQNIHWRLNKKGTASRLLSTCDSGKGTNHT